MPTNPINTRLEVHHINVNDGDSTLILLYDDSTKPSTIQKAVLVDAGWRYKTYRVLYHLNKILGKSGNYKPLDAIVVTHYDSDHASGITELFMDSFFTQNYLKNTYLYDQGDGSRDIKICPYNRPIIDQTTKLKTTLVSRLITQGKIIRPTSDTVTDPVTGKQTFKNFSNNLLGREILWASVPTLPPIPVDQLDSQGKDIKDLRAEALKTVPEIANNPGLFCIGINQHILKTNSPKSNSPNMITLTYADTTIDNQQSIALVAVAPNNEILHYLCGDLDDINEGKIADWLNGQDCVKNSAWQIPFMKFSHHGSEKSTPTKLFKSLKPKHSIVSAGDKHSHPRLSIILYNYYFFNIYLNSLNNNLISTIKSVNCPYYFQNETYNVDLKNLQGLFDTDSDMTAVKLEIDNQINKLTTATSTELSQYYQDIWNEIGKPTVSDASNNSNLYPVGSGNPAIYALRLTFNSGNPRICNVMYQNPPQPSSAPPGRKRTYQAVGTEWVGRLRKRPATSSLMAADLVENKNDNETSLITINGSKNSSSCTYTLYPNCDLDKFVNSLNTKQIKISVSGQPTISNNNIIITGTLDPNDDINSWFSNFAITFSTVTINGSLSNNQITASLTTDPTKPIPFHVTAQIAADQLSLSPSVNFKGFNGVLASDDSSNSDIYLLFTLPTTPQVNTNILQNATYTNYLDSSDPTATVIGTVVNALFPSLLNSPLDSSQTQFIFDPQNLYTTEFLLVNNLGSLSLFDNKFNFSKLSWSFFSRNHTSINNSISTDSSCFFNATLTYSQFSEIEVGASLNSDGTGSLIISAEKSTDIVNDFLTFFDQDIGKTYSQFEGELNSFFDDNVSIADLIQNVAVFFDLTQQKVTSVEFTAKVTIKKYPLLISFSLPHFNVFGYLATTDTQNLNTLSSNCSFDLPHNDFSSFTLSEFSFSASPCDSNYSFAAGIDNIWSFNKEITLDALNINISYNSSTNFDLGINGFIKFGSTTPQNAIYLEADYDKSQGQGTWSFNAKANLFDVNGFIGLFPAVANCALVQNLPSIEFENINLALTLSPTANTFILSADVLINTSNNTTVTFSASYDSSDASHILIIEWPAPGSVNNPSLSIKDIIASTGLDLALPDQLNFTITNAEFSYQFDQTNNNILLGLESTIGDAALVILGQTTPPSDSQSTSGSTKVISVEVDFSKLFDSTKPFSLPIVGNIDFPVHKCQLLYTTASLTSQQVDSVNKLLNSEYQTLIIPPFIQQGDDKTVQQGGQLIITLENISQPIIVPFGSQSTALTSVSDSSASTSSVAWFNLQKSLGPLTVNRLGFGYQAGNINILFDADIVFGSLSLDLEGLSVGFDLNNFSAGPSINLSGLGVGFESGPLEIAGEFLHTTALTQVPDAYAGMVSIGLENFSMIAEGFYGTFNNNKTFFAFLSAAYPIGGPPYFYVEGFAAGFGYNQQLKIPTQDQVTSFALVESVGDTSAFGSDPCQALNKLLPAITPLVNENWLAVGLKFSTFKLVESQALLVAQFGQKFLLNLLGRSTMFIPQDPNADHLAYVEMGLEATLDPEDGFFGLTAVLSPNSYVLDPGCHLTGGFAFYCWFKDNPSGASAGDFVVTLGGYHPKFESMKPAWYPDEPRLGFNWPISDEITIQGQSYFALTPHCVMAGGMLDAEYNKGCLRAWFKAYADFLIEWAPFHYDISIGISMGVSCHVHILFIDTTLELEIGADLSLQGPPLSGTAHVHLWVVSFTFSFGPGASAPLALTWEEFKPLLPSITSSNSGSNSNTSTNTPNINTINCQSGLIRVDTSSGAPPCWIVRADEFTFTIESAIPLSSITFNNSSPSDKSPYVNGINIRPMQINARNSSHTVTVQINGKEDDNNWQFSVLTRNIPTSLWDTWDPKNNPLSISADKQLLPDCWVGLIVKAPPPKLAGNPVGPINLTAAFSSLALPSPYSDGGDIPLNPNPAAAITTAAVNDDSSIALIQSTILETDSSTQPGTIRSQVVDYLTKNGLFSTKRNLFPMAQLANNPTSEFSESPLVTSIPTHQSFLRRVI